MTDHDAKRVYLYKVVPTGEDGRGSTITLHIVSETHDMSDLVRIMRVHLDSDESGYSSNFTGIKSAELVTTAILDPRIGV